MPALDLYAFDDLVRSGYGLSMIIGSVFFTEVRSKLYIIKEAGSSGSSFLTIRQFPVLISGGNLRREEAPNADKVVRHPRNILISPLGKFWIPECVVARRVQTILSAA